MRVLNEYKGTLETTKGFYEVFKECCSTDLSRQSMNYVYYDKEESSFVATDGRRLIVHTDDTFEDIKGSGFYEAVKIGKKFKLVPVNFEGQFPNWQRVLPDESTYISVCIGEYSSFGISGNIAKDSNILCKIIRKLDCCINIEFITKILKHVNEVEIYHHPEDKNKAILFSIDDRTKYIIMPMMD